MRYLPHAVITHFLWGVSWVVISLPLTQTWYDWQLKQAMSSSQVQERGETDEKVEGQKFPDSPIGSLNFIASIVVAILTFGSPLIKAVASVH
jgi:hypothetical protein